MLAFFGSSILALPVAAADLTIGAKIFKANCVACHMSGKNTVMADKNLSLEALIQYNMNSPAAVIAQVTNGKGVMPAFGKRLTSDEIESVAAYVLDQATKEWGKNIA
jgi:cytochrome c6